MKTDTPVLKFMESAWAYCGSNPLSWERVNQDVSRCFHIAAAGFPWRERDIDKIFKLGTWDSDVSRCLGESGIDGLYTTAVSAGNGSAIKEIERYLKRKPIIADKVSCAGSYRKRGRLCIRAEFPWKGEQVTVTSFNKDGHAVCCSYKTPRAYPEKIARRFVISAADVKADRKERK